MRKYGEELGSQEGTCVEIVEVLFRYIYMKFVDFEKLML